MGFGSGVIRVGVNPDQVAGLPPVALLHDLYMCIYIPVALLHDLAPHGTRLLRQPLGRLLQVGGDGRGPETREAYSGRDATPDAHQA